LIDAIYSVEGLLRICDGFIEADNGVYVCINNKWLWLIVISDIPTISPSLLPDLLLVAAAEI